MKLNKVKQSGKIPQPKFCKSEEKIAAGIATADEMLMKIKKRRDYHHIKFSLKRFPYGDKVLMDNTIEFLQNFAH